VELVEERIVWKKLSYRNFNEVKETTLRTIALYSNIKGGKYFFFFCKSTILVVRCIDVKHQQYSGHREKLRLLYSEVRISLINQTFTSKSDENQEGLTVHLNNKYRNVKKILFLRYIGRYIFYSQPTTEEAPPTSQRLISW